MCRRPVGTRLIGGLEVLQQQCLQPGSDRVIGFFWLNESVDFPDFGLPG